MKSISCFIFVFLWMMQSSLQAQKCGDRYFKNVFEQTKVTRNIYFGENLTSKNKVKVMMFDIYEPENDSERLRPVFIMMHGGAYWSGDKNHGECTLLGQDLSKMGYVLISPQYRYEPTFMSLLDEEKMVKAVARGTQDAKAMVRFLFKDVMENGNTWGIDTSLIFIGGASAGAINALHATYLDDQDSLSDDWKTWIEEVGGIDGTTAAEGYPYKVAGVISISGALASASFLNNEHVPFLTVHDTKDPQIPFNTGQPYGITLLPMLDGSNVLHAKALELGIENPFLMIPGENHTSYENFGMRAQPMYDSTLTYIVNFMSDIYCKKQVVTSNSSQRQLLTLQIYPNPSIGNIQIEIPEKIQHLKNFNLLIYDNLGKLVLSKNIESSSSINMANLPAGAYHLVLNHELELLGTASIQLVK